ncbi:MAG: 16S rRNA (uracil(1498)-N(3))-methyltransferase [Deltaproteobacteria bacterium]|nr:16S rRNA (uracil(1498)-N(3))-methyltransferase [Deltaproteobacteria bacterium]
MPQSGKIKINEAALIKGEYTLSEDGLKNLLSWKPRIGEAFTISDADSNLFRARLIELGMDTARVIVFEQIGKAAPEPEITLIQALPEKERMELIIQKATELGVKRVIPFKSEKSTSLEEREALQKKSHKWQEIALKAAKQSRRDTIPDVLPYCSFEEAMGLCEDAGLKLILWERQGITHLKGALKSFKNPSPKVCLLSGPEGGLEEPEIDKARQSGFIPVSLGKRILRTETAAIIGVALVQYELGED